MFVGFTIVIGACTLAERNTDPLPVPVTCRQLRDTPAKYAGYRVIVPTAGTEVENGRLVWKLHSPGDADVEFLFDNGKIPDPLPEELEGICLAPVRGGPVRIVHCK